MLVHRIGVVMYDIEGDLNTFSLEGLAIARNGVRRLYALLIVPHQSLTPTATSGDNTVWRQRSDIELA
jgi:hypothetical protein